MAYFLSPYAYALYPSASLGNVGTDLHQVEREGRKVKVLHVQRTK